MWQGGQHNQNQYNQGGQYNQNQYGQPQGNQYGQPGQVQGATAASVAMGGNSNNNMSSQTSFVPSYASGAQTAATVAGGSSPYGAPNVSAANVAMSNLPKPTTNNPYMKNNSTQSNQFGNQQQNQNYGVNQSQNQNYGRTQNQNYGNTGQTYTATQNYGGNQNATQNYRPNAGGMQTQNYGMQGGQNQGTMQNMNQQANYGTSTFQNQFAQMQMQQQELVEQQRWFTHVDKDRSGSIDASELSQLTFGGKPLHFTAAKKLLLIFDKDKNMNIDFAEYITLHKFIQAMQRAFNATDSDRNGVLDSREIHSALQQAGFQMNFQACNAVYHRYNKHNTGVDFVHFLEIAADIALLRVEFDLKDHDRDGVITLRFDDLLCLIANV